jgi:hypothetical protein
MLDLILEQSHQNIWARLDSTPQGEADPMEPADNATLSENKLSFGDFIDVINPLQHIPIISSIYRKVSGDEIADAPKFVGAALYGGPVGLIAALGGFIIEAESRLSVEKDKSKQITKGNPKEDQARVPNTLYAAKRNEPKTVSTEKNISQSFYPLEQLSKPKVYKLTPRNSSDRDKGFMFNFDKTVSGKSSKKSTLQELKGNGLDKLIKNSGVDNSSPTFGAKQVNGVHNGIVNRQNIERWMLEKLGKYRDLQAR